MAKLKRQGRIRPPPSYTVGPIDEHSGQRSVFPDLVKQSRIRDSEWHYDDQDDDNQEDQKEDFTGQTFTLDQLDFNMEGDEEEDDIEQVEGEGEGLVDEDWEVEPQENALAYLHSVRLEAETLPSLSYVSNEQSERLTIEETTAEIGKLNGVDETLSRRTEVDDIWRTQFLTYYNNLRSTILSAPEPNLTQDELDELLHINPNNRPITSDQEDGLWRRKTQDEPSITLLAMLDHQRTIHLLTHLRKKMSVNVKAEQCMWLVFLLARLGDTGVLSGDEMDLLRRIGRKCVSVKKTLEETGLQPCTGSETVLATADMVICIIKYFYHQKDLEW
jgi:hypothetical protein